MNEPTTIPKSSGRTMTGLLAALGLMFHTSSTILAQQPQGNTATNSNYFNNETYVAPHYSSTATEGKLRGQADFLHGLGDFLRLQSEAEKNKAITHKLYIESQQSETEVRLQLRELKRQSEARAQRERHDDRIADARAVDPARPRTAPRALPNIAVTGPGGKIQWPSVLQRPEYAALRSEIEALSAEKESGRVSDASQRIETATKAMRNELSRRVGHKQVDSRDFPEAKRFIETLAQWARTDSPRGKLASK